MSESDAAYRRGTQRFMDLELEVAPGVLVPRRETELLARTAIEQLRPLAEQVALRVVDLCCGSGNLACAIASQIASARVWASDLTDECVALARRNTLALGLAERITVLQGDLLQPVAAIDGLVGTIHAIVCNPPYISTGRLAERADLANEPREAFDGGPYGLSLHQRAIRDALPLLAPDGLLMLEFGAGQGRQLELLFQRARRWGRVELVCDETGEPRLAVAQRGAWIP